MSKADKKILIAFLEEAFRWRVEQKPDFKYYLTAHQFENFCKTLSETNGEELELVKSKWSDKIVILEETST